MSKSKQDYLKEKIDEFEVNYKSLYDYCDEHGLNYENECAKYNINPDDNSKKYYYINLKSKEVYKFIDYDYFDDGNIDYRIKLPKKANEIADETDFKDQLNKGKIYYKRFRDKHCNPPTDRFNCIKKFTDLINTNCNELYDDDYDRGIKKRNCDLNKIIDEYQQMQEPHQTQNYIGVQSEQLMQYPQKSQKRRVSWGIDLSQQPMQFQYPHQSQQPMQQPMPQQILHPPHQSQQPMQQPMPQPMQQQILHPMQYMIQPPHGMQNMMQHHILHQQMLRPQQPVKQDKKVYEGGPSAPPLLYSEVMC